MPTAKATDISNRARKKFAPPPQLTVSEWADGYRFLSREGSAEPGRWSTDRAPYQREIMDSLTSPGVVEVILMCSAQVGKTEAILNFLGYIIDLDPSPVLYLNPTLGESEARSKERFAPMLRDTPVLNGKVADPRARDSGNTVLLKNFAGGFIAMAGANSPASLASRPVRRVVADEVDRYPASAGTEGDPIALATKRTATFGSRRLIFKTSTPTIKGISRIEKDFNRGDRRHYLVSCPHCGHEHTFDWDCIEYPGKSSEAADTFRPVHVCPNCAKSVTESQKSQMLAAGKWQATAVGDRGVVSFCLNELYSPWKTWRDIAADYEVARKDPEQYKVWWNTSRGLPYELQEGEQLESDRILTRAQKSNYSSSEVPEGVLALVAAVDVQGDRLECGVWGFGGEKRSWLIVHRVLTGNPAKDALWQDLDQWISAGFLHESGVTFPVRGVAVDANYETELVKSQVRARQAKGWRAVRGEGDRQGRKRSLVSAPSDQDVRFKGKRLKGGLKLWTIGVDRAKEVLKSRAKVEEEGENFIAFPRDLDIGAAEQFCSEVQIIKHKNGQSFVRWEMVGERNEVWDCAVYAYALGEMLGLHRGNWQQFEDWLDREIAKLRSPSTREPSSSQAQRPSYWSDRDRDAWRN